MNRYKTTFIIFQILLFTGCFSLVEAQDVSVTASAPRVVQVGEQFRVTFSVNEQPSSLIPPEFDNFDLLGGPSSSSSSSVQIINGKMTQSVEISYTYYLQAEKEGKYEIGAATATVKKKAYKSDPITVEVVKGSAPQQQQQSSSSSQSQQSSSQGDAQISGDNLYIRVLTNKTRTYQGENLVATIKIYSKVNIGGLENFEIPTFAGFYKQEIEIPELSQLTRENVNGEIFYTGVLKQYLLFPQKSGDITIEPASLDVLVQQRVQSRSRSIFDDFFGPQVQTFRKNIKSKPIIIKVSTLPQSAPESFKNAVGEYKFSTTIDKTEAVTNDAITLRVNVTGSGNLKLLDEPEVNLPPSLESYDPKINLNVRNTANGAAGSKTFEYLIIPRTAGNYRIAPIEFTYFNPSTKKYITETSEEINLSIEKGNGDAASTVISGLSKEDVKFIGKDIQFIKQGNPKIRPMNKIFFSTRPFYFVYGIAVILFGLITIIQRERIKRNANVSLVKNRKANKLANKRFKVAKNALKENKKEQFYEELVKGLWGYLGDKLTIPVADISREKAKIEFDNLDIDDELQDNFFEVIDNCEFARYAPVSEGEQMNEDYQKAVNLISKLEQKIK